jgi:signal transduction histidine kinase
MLVGFQGIARDVTERRRAEAERAHRARELAVRILEAQESERKRISRELHDETAQSLSVLLTNLDLLEQYVPRDAAELRAGLHRVGVLAKRVLDEVRTLSHDLRPTILDDVGLRPALEWLAREFEQTYGGIVTVHADPRVAESLTAEEELALFRIAQEALTNSGKHGAAHRVTLSLAVSAGVAALIVEDNGAGFDTTRAVRPSKEGHLGLYGMRERAALLDGTVSISSAPGTGTRVEVEIPLRRAESDLADVRTLSNTR